MAILLKMTFGKSSSPNYRKAKSYLRIFDNVVSKNEIITITIGEEEFKKRIRNILYFLNIIMAWKNSSVRLNNEIIDPHQIGEYSKIIECEKGYRTAVIQERYCETRFIDDEGWGCRYLSTIQRHLPESEYEMKNGRYWFQFGSFRNSKIWKIDKRKIRMLLKREIDLKKIGLCSVFTFKKIDETLKKWPDEIDLEKDDIWTFLYEDLKSGSSTKEKPIGIRPKKFDYSRPRLYGASISLGIKDTVTAEEETKIKNSRNIPNVTFQDIGGINEEISKIREVIELPLKQPEIFKYLSLKAYKGILLYGPPGCGKTLIAKAIANEVKAHFIPIKGPELYNRYFGQSEENLREIFKEAKDRQPSIIFFDEIDAIGQTRSTEDSSRFHDVFLNQLLSIMDGIEDYGNIIVIGATNRIDKVDEALLRPGRFDYKIEIKKPSRVGCYNIFKIKTKSMPLSNKVNIEKFKDRLYGLSGADIEFVVNEAAYNCIRRNVNIKECLRKEKCELSFENVFIEEADFDKALATVKNKQMQNVL